ncbi:MAG TPA: hypothetical protein EYN00_08435 [Planctomycetes bacterium]|nr:hypothetical protein [Planctomycetota bacterium]
MNLVSGSILLVLTIAGVLIGGYLFSISRKRKDGEERKRQGSLLGCIVGVVIVIGLGVGLFKLVNPTYTKDGALVIESNFELPEDGAIPQTFSYHLESYRRALIVDAMSLRIVFQNHTMGPWMRLWFFIREGRMLEEEFRSGTKELSGRPSWVLKETIGQSNTTFEWISDSSNPGEDSGGGVLKITIDGVVITIHDGTADIGGIEVPATGPLQVVFLDPLGGVEEIRQKVADGTSEAEGK